MAALAVAIAACSAAAQQPPHQGLNNNPNNSSTNSNTNNGSGPRDVPEFDPAAVGTVAALVAGGALLISRRRKR